VILVASLIAAPLYAQFPIPIPDPVEQGLLARIAAALRIIQQLRVAVQDKRLEELYNRIRGYAFPSKLFEPIVAITTPVRGIRRELQLMGCNWPTTLRTDTLKDMLMQRATFCRRSYQDVWGSHERFWDGPVHEMNDYVAAMTACSIHVAVESSLPSPWSAAGRRPLPARTQRSAALAARVRWPWAGSPSRTTSRWTCTA
jgi:hypothetical protein